MAEEPEAVPSLVSDPELASMMDTYHSLNRQREEKAKSYLQAEIERLRIELDQSADVPNMGRYVMYQNFASEASLTYAFARTESEIYAHLKGINLYELVEHVASARNHAAVLFECMIPEMIKNGLRRIEDESLDDKLTEEQKKGGESYRNSRRDCNISCWTKLCHRRYASACSADAIDAAADEANTAARALIRCALANVEGNIQRIYTGVHVATPTFEERTTGEMWRSRCFRIVPGWAAAVRWVIVTFSYRPPRAFKAVVFPEIVWSVEVPDVLGPLACLVPCQSAFRGEDNRILFQDGPVLAKLRALCFLPADEVDDRTVLLYGLDLCMDDATRSWRESLVGKRERRQDGFGLHVTGIPGIGRFIHADMQVTWHKSSEQLPYSAGQHRSGEYWSSEVLKLDTRANWERIQLFL